MKEMLQLAQWWRMEECTQYEQRTCQSLRCGRMHTIRTARVRATNMNVSVHRVRDAPKDRRSVG